MRILRRDDGFTLIEVLVVLALLAAIVAIVAPTLFSQLTKGDVTRVAGDLNNVGSAVKAFRVDIQPVFPGDAEDLVNAIDGNDQSVTNTAYSTGQTTRWDGPYLEAEIADADVAASTTPAFTTGFGGSLLSDFGIFNTASSPADNTSAWTTNTTGEWVAIRVDDLTQTEFDEIDEQVDDGDGATSGRLRFDSSNGFIYYLAAQR